MFDIILIIIMILGSGVGGYAIRALQYPVQKRDRKGRFIKK